jgi:malate synthase
MFFSKSPIYSTLPPSVLGSTSLANKLTKVLTESIWRFLPELVTKIKERKAKLAHM